MYSAVEKVKIVAFYEATNSVVVTQQKFCQHSNVRYLPSSKTIKSIVVKFKTKGLVLNQQKRYPGDLKSDALLKILKLSVIEDLKKGNRNVLRH